MSWRRIEVYQKKVYQSKESDLRLFDKWADGKDITTWSSPRGQDFPKYIKTGRDTTGYRTSKVVVPPYLDHVSVFKRSRGRKKVWLTYQPYQDKSNIEQEVIEWAEQYDLMATVYESSESWYWPNHTCLVVITTKE